MNLRQLFEKRYVGLSKKALERDRAGNYTFVPTDTAWKVWQVAWKCFQEQERKS